MAGLAGVDLESLRARVVRELITEASKQVAAATAPVAELRHVDASYRRQPVLRDLSLTLRPSEIYVLMGPNGAGKTTLVRVLTGRLKPAQGLLTGACAIDGKSTAVRLVPQDIALFPLLSARENCIAFAKMAGANWREAAALADRALERTDCAEVASRRVGGLSGGFRRRVNIAVALVGNPRLLILDEPTVGIDADAKAVIARTLQALKQSGMSILIVTHDFDDADALADRAGFLFDGRLVKEGHPRDLLSDAFGTRKHIEIVLASKPAPEARLRLNELGATPARTELVWETFRDLEGDDKEYFSALHDGRVAVKEIMISNPGLGTLYRHLGGSDLA